MKHATRVALAGTALLAGSIGAPLAGGALAHAATPAHYPRGTAHTCRVGYHGKTWHHVVHVEVRRRVIVTVKVKGHDRREVRVVTRRIARVEPFVMCVLDAPKTVAIVAPPTTTPAAPVTTTTAPAPVVTIPPVTFGGGGGGSTGGGGGSSSGTTTVRAAIDPTYTIDDLATPAPPPVPVTFTYSASAGTDPTTGAQLPLPDGTLTLTIYVYGQVSNAGGCQANVGSDLTPTGDPTNPVSCQVNLPAWGKYTLITSYSGGGTVSATGETDTIDVEPPAPSTITNDMTWGISATSTAPSATATVIGSSANVSVTDANWTGITSVPLTATVSGNSVGSCTATITGTTATCSMAVSSTPNSVQVAYPGATTTSNAPYTAWGISQTQTTDYVWAPTTVTVTPTVSVDRVTIGVSSYMISPNHAGVTMNNAPANPLAVPAGDNLWLGFTATGSVSTDTDPTGSSLSVSVTGPATATTTNAGASGSSDCSDLTGNLSGQVSGSTECWINFPSAGTYEVTVGFTTTDPNYGNEPSAYTLEVVAS